MGDTSTGCGYKATARRGKIKIYPTINEESCNIKLGLGNATFTFDPTNPPEALTRIITGDSEGNYAPQVDFNKPRMTRVFDTVSDEETTYIDSEGKEVVIKHKQLHDFEEINGGGEFESSSYEFFRETRIGRTM